MFSYVDVEARMRMDHPLRTIRALVDATRADTERDLSALYSGIGQPSIAPQMLLRAMLLQAFYSVRYVATTESNHDGPIYRYRARNVVLVGPNQLWVADIIYITIAAGFVYLAEILDAWSRRVVG